MGQTLSQDQIHAHLQRQEALINQLKAVVGRPATPQQAPPATSAATTGSAGSKRNAEVLAEEISALERRVTRGQRKKAEPPAISSEEASVPDETWTELTAEELADLEQKKPWVAALRRPSNFASNPANDSAPAVQVELEHVYGCRSSDVRSSVLWVDENTLAYFVGSIGVVHDIRSNQQRFFRGHADDVLSICFHAGRRLVATGDQGKLPAIHVWDVGTQMSLAKLAGQHRRGVVALAFSESGSRLASIGMDDDHSIFLHDWEGGAVIAGVKNGPNPVLGVAFNTTSDSDGNADPITVGLQHIQFWRLEGTALKSHPAASGLESLNFTSVACTKRLAATGTQDGDVYLFRAGDVVRVLHAHQAGVTALQGDRDRLYSGGDDGFIHGWDTESGQRLHTIDMNCQLAQGVPNAVRALDVVNVGQEPRLLAATLSGKVVQLDPVGGAQSTLIDSHVGDLGKPVAFGELWGLASSPISSIVVSAGEDRTLRWWNTTTKRMIRKEQLSARAQCLGWSPDGKWIAVGCQDGRFSVFDDDGLEAVTIRRSRRRVQCLRFSPDSTLLAVGSADASIIVYDLTASFKSKIKVQGDSVPMSIDFSADGAYVQVSTQSYQLIFYALSSGQQVDPSVVRDAEWGTFSSVLGWDVQGIWPQDSDGSEVSAISRSHNRSILAVGEASGAVRLFRYPCIGSGLSKAGTLARRPHSLRVTGHSEQVSALQWCVDDRTLISTGASDLSLFQWRIISEAVA